MNYSPSSTRNKEKASSTGGWIPVRRKDKSSWEHSKHWNMLPKKTEEYILPSGCLFLFLSTFSPTSGLADRWSHSNPGKQTWWPVMCTWLVRALFKCQVHWEASPSRLPALDFPSLSFSYFLDFFLSISWTNLEWYLIYFFFFFFGGGRCGVGGPVVKYLPTHHCS